MYKCNLCDYQSSRNYNLKVHISSVHAGTQTFERELCGKQFEKANHLKVHVSSVHARIRTLNVGFVARRTSLGTFGLLTW